MNEDIKLKIKNTLQHKLDLHFNKTLQKSLQVTLKEDESIVTEIDFLVSDLIKKELLNIPEFKGWTFFSEEDYSNLSFPAFVVDPIDGTKELCKGRDECVVSFAKMYSSQIDDPKNYAWIYNPFSGFELESNNHVQPIFSKSSQTPLGFISRSEWHENLHADFLKDNDLMFAPRGSIAFKLALLASGACDFVVSFRPKSIWDIAAGTILLNKRGYDLYEDGVKITHLDKVRYKSPLIWVSKFHSKQLGLS